MSLNTLQSSQSFLDLSGWFHSYAFDDDFNNYSVFQTGILKDYIITLLKVLKSTLVYRNYVLKSFFQLQVPLQLKMLNSKSLISGKALRRLRGMVHLETILTIQQILYANEKNRNICTRICTFTNSFSPAIYFHFYGSFSLHDCLKWW